jgi:hypothetical protein
MRSILCTAVVLASLGGSLKASHYIDYSVSGKAGLMAAVGSAGSGSYHLFTHGKPGMLLVNGHWIGENEILSFLQAQLSGDRNIREINIYGCAFGKGDKGRAAVEYLQGNLGIPVAASDDITGGEGDWDLEVGSPNASALQIHDYAFTLQYGPDDDFDGDGIPNSVDLDDDNDGILDTAESVPVSLICDVHSPDNATTTVTSSSTQFPTGRDLVNTYDNSLSTFGGTFTGTASMIGTVKYLYNTPLNNVTEFQFYSNGGSILTDGQVTHIASVQFFDASDVLLYQLDDVTIPQASTVTPYVIPFPTVLNGVASFTLTDLSDRSARTGSAEAVWKEVYLRTCYTSSPDIDTDGDGILNRFDLDSDGDGCPDSQEAAVVTDFSAVVFADVNVSNSGGSQPAALSQIRLSTFQDTNGNGFDDRLEVVTEGSYAGTYTYDKVIDPADAICIRAVDTDGDGIPDSIDLDDDNDGILDTEESIPASCTLNYPDAATSDVSSSETVFPTGRELANTHDNNLGTYGGTFTGTASLNGTVTYVYNTPLNNVTEFQFYSNGGGVLTDGQVTQIGSIKFYDASGGLLYQQDNVTIPQASTVTPYILSFPTALNGVTSFTLTDLSDISARTSTAEAVWKEVNLKTCTPQQDLDTDNDGIVNRLDLDSDGDGCPDSQEAAVVKEFPGVQFANMDVENTTGSSPALNSQVAAATFVDTNNNGFDDRFEAALDGVYTGTYTYGNAVNDQIMACSTLPVTLISFGVDKGAEGMTLNWKTSDEKLFSGFNIERSSNPSKGFTGIGFVPGGNNKYRFVDANAGKGTIYYRLKMVDLDGSYAYSRIIQIYQPYGENEHTIYPNPAVNHTLSILNYFPIKSVRVYDVQGNSVGVKITNYADRYQFDVDKNAVRGIYILEYQVDGKVIRRKFSLD